MTTQTIRPDYWRDGDYLYTGGRWLVMSGASGGPGRWTPVPAELGELLDLHREGHPTTTYVTPAGGEDVILWDAQPSPKERADVAAQQDAGATGLTDEEQEFAEQFGDTAKGFATEQEALAVLGNDPNYVIGRNSQGRYIIKPKPRVTKESSFATRPEAEAALGNDPDYEIGRSTDGRYTIKPKPKTDTKQPEFTDEAKAQQYAQSLGNFAYVVKDGPNGFKVVVDESQRRQSMEQQPLRSYDDLIMGAINEGDLARAFQIDQIRDLMGVDRVSLANNVMAFYLENEDANVLQGYRDGTRPIPPMLQQAMDIYRQALSPTGGLNLQMVQQQNAQGPSWMEMAQQYVAAGGVVTRDQNGKPLAEPITTATYPQGPQLYGKLTFNPETGKYEYPNISPPTPTDAEGRFDPAAANRRYAEQNPNSIQAQYQRDQEQARRDAPLNEQAREATTLADDEEFLPPVGRRQPGTFDPRLIDRANQAAQYAETQIPQRETPAQYPTPFNYGDIDEATGEPRQRPAELAAAPSAQYLNVEEDQASSYQVADETRRIGTWTKDPTTKMWTYSGPAEGQFKVSAEMNADPDFQAAQAEGRAEAQRQAAASRQQAQPQPSLANRDIIDPYLTAARKRQQQRRRRTPIYTG